MFPFPQQTSSQQCGEGKRSTLLFWLQNSCHFCCLVAEHDVPTPWRKEGNGASYSETRSHALVLSRSNNKLQQLLACMKSKKDGFLQVASGSCIEITTCICQLYWHLNTYADFITYPADHSFEERERN